MNSWIGRWAILFYNIVLDLSITGGDVDTHPDYYLDRARHLLLESIQTMRKRIRKVYILQAIVIYI